MDGTLASAAPQTRRRAVRRAVDLLAEVSNRAWSGGVPLRVGELSPFGLWVESEVLLEPGEAVDLAFVPPRWPAGVAPLRARGHVVSVQRGRRRRENSRAGMGIAFRDLPSMQALLLARLLRGLPPRLPCRTSEVLPPPLPRRSTPRPRVAPQDALAAPPVHADASFDAIRFEALAPLLTAGRLVAPPPAGRGVVIPFPTTGTLAAKSMRRRGASSRRCADTRPS